MPCVSITLLISFGVVKLQVFFNVVKLEKQPCTIFIEYFPNLQTVLRLFVLKRF